MDYKYIKDLSEFHFEILKERYNRGYERTNVIESKIASLLSQSSIVLAIISLFIPFFASYVTKSFTNSTLYLHPFRLFIYTFFVCICVFIFISCVYCFIRSIYTACSVLDIRKFSYSDFEPQSVIDKNDPDTKETMYEQIIPLYIKFITNNEDINDNKGSKLIQATCYFRYGLLFLVVLCISCIVAIVINTSLC
ncbi:MAG: hypothetical protein H6Q15_2462 [Bacteroidetes bacterium]|nr:hypothetical protein [Bacteroidota bacterium]